MTCNECIHKAVCYRQDSVKLNYAEKCGDFQQACEQCKYCKHTFEQADSDIENKKCYPESKDCRKEYDLTDDDINNGVGRCDFYESVSETVM